MATHFIREFSRKFKKYLTTTKRVIHRLRRSCERAKRTSSSTQDNIQIDSLLRHIDFHTSITPVCFNKLNQNLSKSTLRPVKESLPDTKMDKSQTHRTSLSVHPSSEIPLIPRLLRITFQTLILQPTRKVRKIREEFQ